MKYYNEAVQKDLHNYRIAHSKKESTMKSTNRIFLIAVIVALLLAFFAVVNPAEAQGLTNEVKPVCNSSHSWLDRMLGKCIVIEPEKIAPIVQPKPNYNPQQDFPTMNPCENWTRFLYPECKK